MTMHAVTIWVFGLLGLALLALEVVARLPRSPVPTLRQLLSGGLGRRCSGDPACGPSGSDILIPPPWMIRSVHGRRQVAPP